MSQYEFSFWQYVFPGLRGGWRQPFCDVTDRVLDTTEVSAIHDRPPSHLDGDRVGMPRQRWPHQLDGERAMQMAHPFKKVTWTVGSADYGQRQITTPAPRTGQFWVESNPRPLWQMDLANSRPSGAFFDNHVILIEENGHSHEFIGVSKTFGLRASGYAHWSMNGTLLDGDGVVWSRARMSSQILNRWDAPHRLSVALRGSDHEEPSFPWAGQWLALDPAAAPTGLDGEQQRIVDMLVTHGMVVNDHGGGTGVSWADGAQWGGTTLSSLNLTLGDFKAAT